MSQKVIHIVLNPFIQDSRVIKECKSLAKIGYDVTVIAYWLEGLNLEEMEKGLLPQKWMGQKIIPIDNDDVTL